MKIKYTAYKQYLVLFCFTLFISALQAQTDHDALMMNKGQWCNGVSYMRSQWKNYWEGTWKRDNENIGTVTSQSAMFMTNYGITNKLNVMAGLPYIRNHVSGGTLHKMQGLQDVSLAVKWKPYTATWNKLKISLLAVGSISTPTRNYVVDFLPVSIGLGATNITGRAMVDYKVGKFFTTASAAYIIRSNTRLDREAYYTGDHIIYSNKVAMPNAANYMLSAGLRSKYLIAEAFVSNLTTIGGYDIRRNDMPFVNNRMNGTNVGAHVKYTLPYCTHIELSADGSYTVKGRNAGQATNLGIGGYYIFSFQKKASEPANH